LRSWRRRPADERSGEADSGDAAQAGGPIEPVEPVEPVADPAEPTVAFEPWPAPQAPEVEQWPVPPAQPPVEQVPDAEQVPDTVPDPVDPAGETRAADEQVADIADPVADASPVPRREPGAHRRRKAGREPEDTPAFRQKQPKKKAPWWELPALVALAIVIAVLVKTFLIQPFYIPSASMEKTLHGSPQLGHDRILVNKVIYDFRDPHPGDIIVFNAPSAGWNEIHSTPPGNPILHGIRWFGQLVGVVPPDTEVLVKRVIATGGETVQGRADGNQHSIVTVTDRRGHQHVLVEPYVWNDGPDTHAAFGPVKIPDGRLWVMGDHRNDSQDSRYHCSPDGGDGDFGAGCDPTTSTVAVDDVIGKAFIVAWPPSHWRTLGTPTTFTQLAAAPQVLPQVLPSGVGLLTVVPVYVLRRRRRRRA
jgi:signal peptidase I